MMQRYERLTDGILVRVRPRFSLAQSDLADGRFVFSYRVHLENRGDDTRQLLFRHWFIHDSTGDDTEVDGEGVVGEQPVLGPGASHTYTSFCVLRSPAGYMQGHYTFEGSDGSRFKVPIPRFPLEAPLGPSEMGGGSEVVLH